MTEPRICVECLACYNGGEHVGEWMDALDYDENWFPTTYLFGEPEGLHAIRCLNGCGLEGADEDYTTPCPSAVSIYGAEGHGRPHYRGIMRLEPGTTARQGGPDADVVTFDREHEHHEPPAEWVPHEEQWVFDLEGFDGMLDGECSPDQAKQVAEKIAELESEGITAEEFGFFADGQDDPTVADFRDAYYGTWNSVTDFAYDYAENTFGGFLRQDQYGFAGKPITFDDAISEWPFNCIDWEHAARELVMGDFEEHELSDGKVMILRRS